MLPTGQDYAVQVCFVATKLYLNTELEKSHEPGRQCSLKITAGAQLLRFCLVIFIGQEKSEI